MRGCKRIVRHKSEVVHLPPNTATDLGYEIAEDCVSNAFVQISNVSNKEHIPSRTLLAIIIFTLITFIFCTSAIILYKCRRRKKTESTKTLSSDAMLTSGDNLWTYNSMKTSQPGSAVVLPYSRSHAGSRIFHQPTPTTLRSYLVEGESAWNLRHSQSTILRLHPNEQSAAYHTLGKGRTPSDMYYEEIPIRMTSTNYSSTPMFCATPPAVLRHSIRKPPPTCRPPPVPLETSPPLSELSLDHEIRGVDTSPKQWDDVEIKGNGVEGRESGYDSGPSRRNWRSPPALNNK
ncbi:hypothetical protein WR25_19893 isoform A [Diploscapter pachys]|uniref:Uncharacterized protein n=2 Tax=Diploscapter pachys TaxID=2018661 RepID=A0A2A2LBG0_9BILA|nr:hypothetical protein WR25_19893 isoform A [Diploscapter pachys]